MRSRVKELHAEYCVPKSQIYVTIWDTELKPYEEPSEEKMDSIDVYVDIVV